MQVKRHAIDRGFVLSMTHSPDQSALECWQLESFRYRGVYEVDKDSCGIAENMAVKNSLALHIEDQTCVVRVFGDPYRFQFVSFRPGCSCMRAKQQRTPGRGKGKQFKVSLVLHGDQSSITFYRLLPHPCLR